MKRLICIAFLFTACASNQQSTGPDVQVALTQLNNPTDAFYLAGPVNVAFQLTVTNPTNQPIKLQRVDLATTGPGAYDLHTSGNIRLNVPANSTATQTIYAWGRSRGGYLTSNEPVNIRTTAVFSDSTGHSFQRMALQNLSQQ